MTFEILFILWLPCFYSFSWLFEILFTLNDFPCFPWFVRSWLLRFSLFLFIFMTFWDFVHFHDFLRFCSCHDFWDFVHFHDFFEILFIFMAFPFFYIFRDFLRFCSCSWDFVHVHAIVQNDRKVEPKSCSVVHPKKIKIQFFIRVLLICVV